MINIYDDIVGRESLSEKFLLLGKKRTTYSAFNKSVDLLKIKLKEAGCKELTRIGICAEQGLVNIAALLAIRKIGAVSVLLSSDSTMHEINKVIKHSEISFIINEVLGKFDKDSFKCMINIDDLNCEIIKSNIETYNYSEKNDATIIYSSGTTGDPKGVVLTENGISSNVKAVCKYLDFSKNDISPIFLPSHYGFSLSQNLTHLWKRASLIPIKTKLIFPSDILRSIIEYNATSITGPPSAYNILLNTKINEKNVFNSIEKLHIGGIPIDFKYYQKIKKTFPKAKITNVYGCTENSPRVSYFHLNGNYGLSKNNYFPVGKSVDGTKIRVIKNHRNTKTDQIGTIFIKGKSLMKGYWKNEKLTNERLVDGWFNTRDLGYLDNHGLLHLSGRVDTMINTGHHKVYPEEVESIIKLLDGVRDAFVYGSKDNILGQKIVADIVIDSGSNITDRKINRHCSKYLSRFKVPKEINFVTSIKKTPYGKTKRN